MNDLKKMRDFIKKKRSDARIPKYRMKKLTIGVVSCLIGFSTVFTSSVSSAYSQDFAAISNGGTFSIFRSFSTSENPQDSKHEDEEKYKINLPLKKVLVEDVLNLTDEEKKRS